MPADTIPLVDPVGTSPNVFDVRQAGEWDTGHLPGAALVELADVADAALPDAPLTVMCDHGERAMTGASVLQRLGRRDLSVLRRAEGRQRRDLPGRGSQLGQTEAVKECPLARAAKDQASADRRSVCGSTSALSSRQRWRQVGHPLALG